MTLIFTKIKISLKKQVFPSSGNTREKCEFISYFYILNNKIKKKLFINFKYFNHEYC